MSKRWPWKTLMSNRQTYRWIFLLVGLITPLFAIASAQENSIEKPLPTSIECQKVDESLAQIREQKKQKQQDCDDPNLTEEQRTQAKKDLAELERIEKKLEEERLKILFLDVNSVMEAIGSGMDWTANALDGAFADDDAGKDKAKAWGHVVFAWEPREGQLVDSENFPVKFKVKAKLPNLQNKVELILSDSEDDDFQTLPYESVRPEALRLSENSLGAAIQFLSSKGKNIRTSSRLGIGDRQVYVRSSLTYRQKYLNDLVTMNISPAIEYYASDGWGARALFDTGYKLTDTSEMRFNASLQDRQSFDDPKFRWGVFNIKTLGQKRALITGVSTGGEVESDNKFIAYSRRISTRYRFNALRRWVYFEIEPFIEFIKDDKDDFATIGAEAFRDSFVRDRGITIRFEAHYGFL